MQRGEGAHTALRARDLGVRDRWPDSGPSSSQHSTPPTPGSTSPEVPVGLGLSSQWSIHLDRWYIIVSVWL